MKLQVLVSTMNQSDYSLLTRMNIQCDAIIINQCDVNEVCEFDFRGYHIIWYSCDERGIGLSRNTALMRATADILLFSDDDVIYDDNYTQIILRNFERYSSAGLIAFNLPSKNTLRKEFVVEKEKRIHLFNCLKYGAARVAVRRAMIFEKRICFSLLFGGGAEYSAGEDNLFVSDCIKNHIKSYAVTDKIGLVLQEESTWFKGYTSKYFMDKGILLYSIYGYLAHFLSLIICLKNRDIYIGVNIKTAVIETWRGIRKYKYDMRERK